MAVVRTHFENCNEVGVFSKLTNAYCLIGIGRSANFFAAFESELDEVVPVIYSTIGGGRIVGRMTVGKSIKNSWKHNNLCDHCNFTSFFVPILKCYFYRKSTWSVSTQFHNWSRIATNPKFFTRFREDSKNWRTSVSVGKCHCLQRLCSFSSSGSWPRDGRNSGWCIESWSLSTNCGR